MSDDDNIVHLPAKGFRSGDGGPEDPMLDQRVGRLEEDMKDVKASLRTVDTKLGAIEIALAKIDGRLTGMDGRLAGMEGRLAGMDSKIGSIPTTWTILGIVFTTWALGSGILIFAMNFLKR
jgi:hypothetical protein